MAEEVEEPGDGTEENQLLGGVNSVKAVGEGEEMQVDGGIEVSHLEKMGEKTDENAEKEGKKSCLLVVPNELADAKFMGAALITEVVQSPARASPRLAGVTAEHTLVRAERMMQSRNLEFSKGNKTSDPDYVIPFPNVVDNLRDLGLGVGKNSGASFEENVRNLMNDTFVNNKPSSVLGEVEDEFSDIELVNSDTFEKKALDFLCGDLMEEIFDEDSYHLSSDLKTVQRKPGAKSSMKGASRKLKVRINKISKK